MSFPTTVNLKMGWEKDETSSQKHKLGTRGVTPDGRIFYYAENSGTAIDHGGYLVDGIAAVAAHDMDLAATATTAGSTSFTSGTSLTVTKNQYKDGYVYFNDGPGQGETYMVKSNTAVSSATGLSITIDDEDGVQTALTTSSLFGLMYNPYKDIKKISSNVAVDLANVWYNEIKTNCTNINILYNYQNKICLYRDLEVFHINSCFDLPNENFTNYLFVYHFLHNFVL